jgi:hypothetical protein
VQLAADGGRSRAPSDDTGCLRFTPSGQQHPQTNSVTVTSPLPFVVISWSAGSPSVAYGSQFLHPAIYGPGRHQRHCLCLRHLGQNGEKFATDERQLLTGCHESSGQHSDWCLENRIDDLRMLAKPLQSNKECELIAVKREVKEPGVGGFLVKSDGIQGEGNAQGSSARTSCT